LAANDEDDIEVQQLQQEIKDLERRINDLTSFSTGTNSQTETASE